MFLDRVIHSGDTFGDQVKERSPKKLNSFLEVANLVHVKLNLLSFNMIFFHASRVFLHQVIHFWEDLGDKVKGRCTQNVTMLIEVP